MTLPERLREHAEEIAGCAYCEPPNGTAADIMTEAADKIERLGVRLDAVAKIIGDLLREGECR